MTAVKCVKNYIHSILISRKMCIYKIQCLTVSIENNVGLRERRLAEQKRTKAIRRL